MRTLLKIFIFLVFIAIGVIVFAPATLLDRGLNEASRGKWRLAETEGTLWSGSGVLTQSAQGAVLTPVRWRFEPSALFDGAARWNLIGQNSAPSLSGVLTLRKTGIELDGLSLHTSIAVLQPLLPGNTVQALEGQLIIDAPSLLLQPGGQQGQIKGRWQDAQLVFQNIPLDLGNVAFNVDSTAQGSHALIKNEAGMLRLDGDFKTDTKGKPASGQLKITPQPNTPPALVQWLSTMGKAEPDGSYILEMK